MADRGAKPVMDFKNSKGMVLDGIAASQVIDSSGEILEIAGADISTLDETGTINVEHMGSDHEKVVPGEETIGRIIYARKVLKQEDCESERQRMYWRQVKSPYIYIVYRLYDGAGHRGAQAFAAQIRDAVAHNEKILVRLSVEGSTLQRSKEDKNRIVESVCRKVSATLSPCNRTCDVGVIADPNAPTGYESSTKEEVKDLLADLVDKGEPEHPAYARLGGAVETAYIPFESDDDTMDKLRLVAKAKMLKAITAGSYAGTAPSDLSGGAALQVEDRGLRHRMRRAVTEYQGAPFDKAEFRAFAKNLLPEADDSFLDHFTDVAHDIHARKLKKDEGDSKKPMSWLKPKEDKKKQSKRSPAPAKPVVPEAPVEAVPSPAQLTIRGKATAPTTADAIHFDEKTGILHLPASDQHSGGQFPMYIPSRDTEANKNAFHHIMHDEKVNKFHDYAMDNWARMNEHFKNGTLPPEAVMHATLFSQLSPNCLDAETEALTQRGWVKGFDLRMDDLFLTKNAETGRLEWQAPLDLRLFPDYEGPMVEFKSRSFYALTTPDHEWLVTTGRGRLRIKKSVDIAFDNDRIHRTGEYFGPEVSGLTPDEAEVLGWFVTDGMYSVAKSCNGSRIGRSKYETPGVYARLCQSTTGNPEKCARIAALLDRVGGDEVSSYVEASGKAVWTLGPRLTKMLLERVPNRYLTVAAILDLNGAALDRLREAMVLGDGYLWSGAEDWTEKECLVTGRKEQADAFQALLTMTGNASSMKWRDMSKYEPRSDKMKNVPKMTGCHVVTALQRQYVRISKHQRRDIHNMKVGVWCPILPNMFFVARRQGHVFITKNTPVPIQELMYSHLVDSMKHTGIDARDPKFAGTTGQDWLGRDSGTQTPQHSPEHWERLGNQIRVKGKQAKRPQGQLMSFMLANNKLENMAKYHQLHDQLHDLVGRHKGDARGAVAEMMQHKVQAGLQDATRERALAAGKPDPGNYTAGPNVAGLAPKTARYTLGMLGGGNVHVPDTHFVRYMFGLDKGHPGDREAIGRIKDQLWNERNGHVLDAIDRYYAQHHDAVQHMMQHPRFGHLFKNPEEAIFPAFWKNWVAIAPHERVRGLKTNAFNEYTDHRPYWEATEPFLKAEDMDLSLPARTATIQSNWEKQHGQMGALVLFYAHLAPKLLAAAAHKSFQEKAMKAEGAIISLRKAMSDDAKRVQVGGDYSYQDNPVLFGGRQVVPGAAFTHNGKYALLHEDASHYVAVPDKCAKKWEAEDMVRLPKERENTHYWVTARPSVLVANLEK